MSNMNEKTEIASETVESTEATTAATTSVTTERTETVTATTSESTEVVSTSTEAVPAQNTETKKTEASKEVAEAPKDGEEAGKASEDVSMLTAPELLKKGQELAKAVMASKAERVDYEDALEFFSKGLEKIVAEKGELHEACVEFYIEYGRVLLESSKAESSVLGRIEEQQANKAKEAGDKPEAEKMDIEEMEGDKPEASTPTEEKPAPAVDAETSEDKSSTVEKKADISEKKTAAPEGDGKTSEESVTTESTADEKTAPAPKDGKAEEESSSEKKKSDDDYVEPRQLAWELFESARVILTKQEKPDSGKLSGLHVLLGETAMEDGNFERSYKEYVEAIKVLGKGVSESDPRLASAHQMAGICSLYDQQMEAAIYHYTASAEGFNNQIAEMLQKHEIVKKAEKDSEMIEFVDDGDLDKLKQKLSEDHSDFKKAMELNQIVNSLIDRVNDIQQQEEEDAANPELQNVIRGLATKLAEKFGEVAGLLKKDDGKQSTNAGGFDKPTTTEAEEKVNVVPVKRKREAEQDLNPTKKTKLTHVGGGEDTVTSSEMTTETATSS